MTFQARDVAESRYIFDQMAVLGPIMLALTAGTPILQGRLVVRGLLVLVHIYIRWLTPSSINDLHPHICMRQTKQDTDVRWDTIAGSVDDRTPAERGELTDPRSGHIRVYRIYQRIDDNFWVGVRLFDSCLG